MELELATNTELLEELTRRSTFLGIIVHYSKDYKEHEKEGIKFEDFVIQARGMPPDVAAEVLGHIAVHINESLDTGDILYHEESEEEI